jgi:UPF0271 protein
MSTRTTDTIHPAFDLNCDLGEGEGPDRAAALMAQVDSANIACGGHAGDDASMRWCLETAARLGVRAGAHPGFPSRQDFGRGQAGASGLTVAGLEQLLAEQVGRLADHAARAGVGLRHVKLHGALYHAVERDETLAGAYLSLMASRWPGLRVFALAGGVVERQAAHGGSGVEVWAEGFLDRGYQDDRTLVPRGDPGAMLENPGSVVERVKDLRERGGCRSVSGRWLELRPRTLCVHGDGARALEFLEAIRGVMTRRSGE